MCKPQQAGEQFSRRGVIDIQSTSNNNVAMNAKKIAVSRPIKISSMNFAARYGSDNFTAAVKIEQSATRASDAL
ncbi:MAG: hypothetical protein IJ774_00810 [Selenomonadaceae bacterium]|nr:hypothetical protein [Selenomonadaceae bacterium]